MKKETFQNFWKAWATLWLDEASLSIDGEMISVKSLCSLKQSACDDVFQVYCEQKRIIKREYFKNRVAGQGDLEDPHLSRYKRAAVLTYAILIAEPILYSISNEKARRIKKNYEKRFKDLKEFDIFFLKQRLAFYISLGSIIQDFPKSETQKVIDSHRPVFQLEELGKGELWDGEDDFCMSLYKDLFFSEFYENYNVLTMANVYGLLTERCSNLPVLKEKH